VYTSGLISFTNATTKGKHTTLSPLPIYNFHEPQQSNGIHTAKNQITEANDPVTQI